MQQNSHIFILEAFREVSEPIKIIEAMRHDPGPAFSVPAASGGLAHAMPPTTL